MSTLKLFHGEDNHRGGERRNNLWSRGPDDYKPKSTEKKITQFFFKVIFLSRTKQKHSRH